MDNRFELVKYEEMHINVRPFVIQTYILRDKLTGVMYLANILDGNAGGITALLDKEGKPMTSF